MVLIVSQIYEKNMIIFDSKTDMRKVNINMLKLLKNYLIIKKQKNHLGTISLNQDKSLEKSIKSWNGLKDKKIKL